MRYAGIGTRIALPDPCVCHAARARRGPRPRVQDSTAARRAARNRRRAATTRPARRRAGPGAHRRDGCRARARRSGRGCGRRAAARAELRGRALPGLALRPGEEREARPDQVERRDASGRPRQPDVLDALAEVDVELAPHVPRASRSGRPSARRCARRRAGARARRSRAAPASAQPRSTQPSFQPRSKPSWMAVFMPVPPRGVTRWAASPIRNALSRRKSSAICAANENAPIRSICGSAPGRRRRAGSARSAAPRRSRPPARRRDPSTRRRASGRPLRRAGRAPGASGRMTL